MNKSVIRYILGCVLKVEAALLLLPSLVGFIYKEKQGIAFVIVAALCFILGTIMSFKKPENFLFYLKEGCVATALSWIFLSIFGALPFVINLNAVSPQ